MYQQFFGLKESPYSIAPNPRYLYMSERHREALAHLIYGLNSDGAFILLSGDVGTGKTTVSRCLLEQLNENTRLALVLNPKVSVQELLATICDELRITYPKDNTSVKVFVDYINRFLLGAHALGHKVVVLIDEAQNLQMDVLEQLRLLTNLETNERKLLQIILLGQPELLDMLARPELSQLSQRITARYHLKPLNQKEVQAYMNHRLRVAGATRPLFDAAAIKQVAELTAGVPRLINVLCDRSLLGAYVQNKTRVDKKTVQQAGREVLPAYRPAKKTLLSSPGILAALLVIMVLVLGIFFWQKKSALTTQPQQSHNNIVQQAVKTLPAAVVKKTKTDLVAKAKKSDDIKLKPLVWPKETERLRSNLMAFQSLLSAWGLNYDSQKNGSPCFYAQSQGLACMQGQGNMKDLRDYNRPAVLKLIDDKGQPVYAALMKIKKDTAYLNMAGKDFIVPLHDLQQHWYGDFNLLWKPPPFYTSAIRPGYEGEEVVWLSQLLNKLDKTHITPETRQYNQPLLEKVRQFQLQQGLVADGVVGAQTLIHLNHAVSLDAPVLESRS